MRRALQKAAPHAFRPPAANPAARPGRPETRKTAPPARTAPKAVVNGAAEEGWEEF